MKGHGAGVNEQRDLFFFVYFIYSFFFLDPRFFPLFSSLSPLRFFSFVLCICTARLFVLHSFALDRVILPIQCGKMNFFGGEQFTMFSDFGGFCCASCMCWAADIHTIYSLCTVVFKCTKPLDMLTFTSASAPFKKHLAAITHKYVIAVERICNNLSLWS